MQYGATPIIAAIMNGHKDVVEVLLDANADIGALKTPVRLHYLLSFLCTHALVHTYSCAFAHIGTAVPLVC